MIDIFNDDGFSTTTLTAAITKLPYRPMRLGPGGLNLFDERPIETTSIGIEEQEGQLSLIPVSPRGAPGDYVGSPKRKLRSFVAHHLSRSAKVMADEVQNVRVFGSENQRQTIEVKRDEKLAIIRSMHEATWEFHRVGALTGKVLDADGTTVILDTFQAFGVEQQVQDFQLTNAALDVRAICELVADKIDDELGASTYERLHVFAGGAFFDAIIKHPYVVDVLKAAGGAAALRLLEDRRTDFTIGPLTFERAKRWRIKNHLGVTLDMIHTDQAFAFPVGATVPEGPLFIGRFAPQPFEHTVNRLNPPIVVVAEPDPKNRFVELEGVSCPLYLNTRPRTIVKLTKS